MDKYIPDKKVRYVKTESGEYRVDILSIYDENCSEQRFLNVNERTLAALEAVVREENNYNRKLRNHPDFMEFNEVLHGELYGCREDSFEEKTLERIWFEDLLKKITDECGEVAIRRVKLAVDKNLSARAVAEIENVHHSTVDENFKKVKEALYKYTGVYIDFNK